MLLKRVIRELSPARYALTFLIRKIFSSALEADDLNHPPRKLAPFLHVNSAMAMVSVESE